MKYKQINIIDKRHNNPEDVYVKHFHGNLDNFLENNNIVIHKILEHSQRNITIIYSEINEAHDKDSKANLLKATDKAFNEGLAKMGEMILKVLKAAGVK